MRFDKDIPKDKLLEGFRAIVDSGAGGGMFQNGNYVVRESVVDTLKELKIPFDRVSA